MKRTSILAALAIVLLPASVMAQAGKSGLSFLKLGVTGSAVALGDAVSANVAGAAATFYNPAGLVNRTQSSTQIALMHREWIQDVRSEFLGASTQLSESSALGFHLNTATVSDIEIRTRPGAAEGTFSSRDYALGLSYARSFSDEVRIGITAKYLFEKIFVDEANGFAFDLGMQYTPPIENVTVGLVIANLGSINELRTEKITLPALLRVGPAYSFTFEEWSSRVTLATDLLYIFPEKKSYLNAGAEFLFSEAVAARVGYQAGSESRGLSTGIGVQYSMFQLDYAYIPLSSNLGSGHTFSLLLNL